MKSIKYIVAAALAAMCVTSCDWFKLDNQEGYNASVYGTITDSQTGAPVLSEIYGQSSIYGQNVTTGFMKVTELGWEGKAQQIWYVKNNGTYRNNLTFAGDYRMETYDANYYPAISEFKLKRGENEVNFSVLPYARVTDHKISYNTTTKKIEATCTVEVTDPMKTNKISEIRLCCYTDNFVGSGLNGCKNDPGAVAKNVAFDEKGKATVTLSIDPSDAVNSTEFKYEREHYVRLAVCAVGPGVNTASRYNFSPTYCLKLDGSAPVEYNKW